MGQNGHFSAGLTDFFFKGFVIFLTIFTPNFMQSFVKIPGVVYDRLTEKGDLIESVAFAGSIIEPVTIVVSMINTMLKGLH